MNLTIYSLECTSFGLAQEFCGDRHDETPDCSPIEKYCSNGRHDSTCAPVVQLHKQAHGRGWSDMGDPDNFPSFFEIVFGHRSPSQESGSGSEHPDGTGASLECYWLLRVDIFPTPPPWGIPQDQAREIRLSTRAPRSISHPSRSMSWSTTGSRLTLPSSCNSSTVRNAWLSIFPQSAGDSVTVAAPAVIGGVVQAPTHTERILTLSETEIQQFNKSQFIVYYLQISAPGANLLALQPTQTINIRVWAELTYQVNK